MAASRRISAETFFDPRRLVAQRREVVRLEPGDDPRTIEEGVEARIKDPLWMLGRQMQMGELSAKDSASVARAELVTSYQKLTTLTDAAGNISTAVDPTVPLEAQVESESTSGTPAYWDRQQLGYSFGLRSPSGAELSSGQYAGGRLDWFDFDVASLGTWQEQTVVHFRPTPVSFPGAPHARFWALEDRRVDLGSVERTQLNMLNLLSMEFALLYENDWYLLPIEQQVGQLRRVDRLTTIDSFGLVKDATPTVDRSADSSGFEVFTLGARSGPPPDGRVFFAPHVRHRGLQAESAESVSFLRDEGANLAWAIEHHYTDAAGNKITRADESSPPVEPARMYWDTETERLVGAEEVVGQDEPGTRFRGPVEQYVPQTYVPVHWIPYQPTQVAASGHLILRRSRTQLDEGGTPQYRSQLLAESPRLSEQAISRLGTRVTRQLQMVRSTDGRRISWQGRQVHVDEYREPSGLRFDALARPPR